jgi:GGDEF domain-containing protein
MVDNVYAQTIAKRIIDKLSKSFMIEGNELHISASIGIADIPHPLGQNSVFYNILILIYFLTFMLF